MNKGCLIGILVYIFCWALSFALSAGIMWLICWAFSLVFQWKIVFGIWLVLCLLWLFFTPVRSKK